jgi:putative sterol carrier protein
MSRLSKTTFSILSTSELKAQILSLPPLLFPSFNLLLETKTDTFAPTTVIFSRSGEVNLKPGFDFSLDLTVRANPDTWEDIISGRSTLLSEFFRGRVRFRNQRTAWNRFCLLSYFLAKK